MCTQFGAVSGMSRKAPVSNICYCPLGEIDTDLCEARRNNALKLGNRRFTICIDCTLRTEYAERIQKYFAEKTESENKGNHILVCEYCGKEFRSNIPNRKYCSRECYSSGTKKRNEERRKIYSDRYHSEKENERAEMIRNFSNVCGCRVYDSSEAAEILGVTPSKLSGLVRVVCVDDIHCKKILGRMYISEEAIGLIREYMRKQGNKRRVYLRL